MTVRTRSAQGTQQLGAELARRLAPGDVVLVNGELGSGKTTLIRGACRGLGVSEPVVSPTFVVGRRYSGRIPVAHLDLYRLQSIAAEEPGLLDDYLTPDAVAFVEWPAAAELELGAPAVTVEIRHAGGDERDVEIRLAHDDEVEAGGAGR